MSEARILGLLLVLAGIGVWFLVPRVVRKHHPSDPEAHTRRPRIAGVWSEERRSVYVWSKRLPAAAFVIFGVLLLLGVIGD